MFALPRAASTAAFLSLLKRPQYSFMADAPEHLTVYFKRFKGSSSLLVASWQAPAVPSTAGTWHCLLVHPIPWQMLNQLSIVQVSKRLWLQLSSQNGWADLILRCGSYSLLAKSPHPQAVGGPRRSHCKCPTVHLALQPSAASGMRN